MRSEEGQATRVLIVDDHVTFAEALSVALNMTPDLKCVAVTSDPASVEELLRVTGARMVISDQHLSGGATGLALISELRARHPRLLLVVLTGFPTPSVVSEAAQLGVSILSKSMAIKDTVTSLRQIVNGERPDGAIEPTGPDVLSTNELQVLELLGQGVRVVDIAEIRSISVHTARDHVKAVLRKLGVSSQLEAVIIAQRDGLIAPPS